MLPRVPGSMMKGDAEIGRSILIGSSYFSGNIARRGLAAISGTERQRSRGNLGAPG